MFSRTAKPLSVVAALLAVGALAGASSAPAPASKGWTVTAGGVTYNPAQIEAETAATEKAAAANSDAVQPDYNPVVIGECNALIQNTVVSSYNSQSQGKITMYCGFHDADRNTGQGYNHIRAGHGGDWQKLIDTYPIGGSWDDFMEFNTASSIQHPKSGYPVPQSGNKSCYTTPITILDNGKPVKTINPTISVSNNNKLIITSFPTTSAPNCA